MSEDVVIVTEGGEAGTGISARALAAVNDELEQVSPMSEGPGGVIGRMESVADESESETHIVRVRDEE